MVWRMKQLFMLAIEPPADLAARIDAIRQEFAARYRCSAGLRPQVHLTLYPPFRINRIEAEVVAGKLAGWAATQQPFTLSIPGFDCFRRNGVLFLALRDTERLNMVYQETVRIIDPHVLPQDRNRPFHPHITIAKRDIPKSRLREALDEYLPRHFSETFTVDRLFFWRHNGSSWKTMEELLFQTISE